MTAPSSSDPIISSHPHKQRSGWQRLWHATAYSLQGLYAAWHEKAFRLETILALVLLPSAVWLGHTWLERSMLMATVLLVLIVELLNSGIEAAIDRIGPELHPLSKKAKDLGSAAVFLSLLLCLVTWGQAIYERCIA